jgi:hypothetical protein
MSLQRCVAKVFIMGWLFFVFFFFSACAVPVPYGPYYRPVYPEKTNTAWVSRTIEGAGPPTILRMRSGLCYMGLRAHADEEQLTLSWTQEEPGGGRCRIAVHGSDLGVEDLETGRRWTVRTFRRVFTGRKPGVDVGRTVDPIAIVPGFAAVPASERRYTVSIMLRRRFSGPLPDSALIQLPDIAIGERVVAPLALRLEHHANPLQQMDDYVPLAGRKAGTATLLSEFGASSPESVYIWDESHAALRLGASFKGTTDSYDGNPRKGKASEIFGRVYVVVRGDLPIRLTDGRAAWHAPGDEGDVLVSVFNSKWALEMVTTANLSERLDHLPAYRQPDQAFPDHFRDFVAAIPGYRPERFRVMLPQVFADGHEWPLQPVVFEYRTGGFGLGGL